MKRIQLFEQFLNERAKWDVKVNEPYSEKAEKKSSSYKLFIDPITIKEVVGQIDDDYTDLNIEFSNGDEIYYQNNFGGQMNCVITKASDKSKIDVTNAFEKYMGSTGTVTGDLTILYRDHFIGKI